MIKEKLQELLYLHFKLAVDLVEEDPMRASWHLKMISDDQRQLEFRLTTTRNPFFKLLYFSDLSSLSFAFNVR